MVHLFELRRGDVAGVLEEPAVVEPIHPLQGGELHIFEGLPGTALSDHLGLLEAVDGQAVNIAAAPPEGHLQRVQGQIRARRGGDLPTKDPAGVGVLQSAHEALDRACLLYTSPSPEFPPYLAGAVDGLILLVAELPG